MPDLSIVIVSYNTRDLLRDCLASIPGSCGPLSYETFVVDNASSDSSADMVEKEFPAAKLIRNHTNAGFAAANNQALRQATGRYVLLLNPDTVAHPEALHRLAAFMEANPRAGFCGPRLRNFDGTNQMSAGRFHTLLSDALPVLGLAHNPYSRHLVDLHQMHGYEGNFRVDWLTGACLMVRAELVPSVGLLDEGYFMYFEEVDWCRRMVAAGCEGWYVGAAEVTHLIGQSIGLVVEARAFWGHNPRYYIASYRRYMRSYYGYLGMLIASASQVLAYLVVWGRNQWPFPGRNRYKAKRALFSIYHLLT